MGSSLIMAGSRWQQGQLLVLKCCTLAGDESMEAGHLRIHSANLVSRMSERSIKGWQWCVNGGGASFACRANRVTNESKSKNCRKFTNLFIGTSAP